MNQVGIRLSLQGQQEMQSGLQGVNARLGELDTSSRMAAGGADLLRNAMAGIATIGTVTAMVKMADAATILQTQLRLSSNSAIEASRAYSALFDIAQQSRVSFTELGTTYASIARAGQELGVSQDRLLQVTKSISQAMTISGGSAESMKAALVQLGQGLSSGVLRGEELNSVMEQTPRLAKALADGLGVPIGKLRELGAAGQLTSEKVIGALEKAGPQLAREMASATLTVGQAFTLLSNSAVKFTGEADGATGASLSLATALKSVSTGVDSVGQAFKENEAAIKVTLGVIAGVTVAAALPYIAVAGAVKGVAIAVGLLNVALAANPAVMALLGLGAVVGGGAAYLSQQQNSVGGMATSIKNLGREIEITEAKIQAAGGKTNAAMAANLAQMKARLLELRKAVGESAIGIGGNGDRELERAQKREKEAKAAAAAASSATTSSVAAAKAAAKEREKIQSDALKADAEFAKAVRDLQEGSFRDEMKRVAALAEAKIKAAEKATEAYIKELDARDLANADAEQFANDYAQTVEAGIKRAEFELGLMNLSEQARAVAVGQYEIQLELEEKILAVKKLNAAADVEAAQISVLETAAARKKAAVSSKVQLDEWQKTADKINDTLTDALMRGFEDGKGFAENMRDTVVNMFKTLVLRPVISAIMQPVAQGIQGALGLGGAAQAGGGASGALGTASNLYSGFSTLTGLNTATGLGALFASNAAYGAAIGTTSIAAGSQAAMLAAQTGTFGAAGVAATSSAAAGAGAGASSALSTAGPYALAALAVYSLFKSMDDSGTYHSGGTGAYSADKGVGYGGSAYSFGMGDSEYRQDANEASAQVAMAVSGIIDTAAGIAGSSAKSFVGTGYADDSSSDGAWGGLLIKLGDKLVTDWGRGGDKWPGREFSDGAAGQKEYLTAITTDVRKAIDDIGLPGWAQEYIDKLGDGAGLEQLGQALEQIKLTDAAFKGLGEVFTGLANLSDGAKTQLLKVAGGIEALAGVASAYYDNFYTQDEKAARLTGQTAKAFEALGLVMPAINDATRANYRALIDELAAKDLSIEANAKAYAGALSLQGAMNELAPAFETAANGVSEITKALQSTGKGLQDQWDKLYLSEDQYRAKQIAGMTALQIAQYDTNVSIQKSIDAFDDVGIAAELAADAFTDMVQGLLDAADTALAGVNRAVDAERNTLTTAYNAATEAIQSSLSTVGESIGKLTSLASTLKSTLDSMRIAGSEPQYRAQAQAQISQALAAARGGSLPLDGQLDSALRTVSQPSEQLFGSFEDYARDFYKTANDIAALSDLTDTQLSIEEVTKGLLEKQLAAIKTGYEQEMRRLDEVLRFAQSQVDALNGIDNGVTSVADAINALTNSIGSLIGVVVQMAQSGQLSPGDAAKRIAGSGIATEQWSTVKTPTGNADIFASAGGAFGVLGGAGGVDIYAKDGNQFSKDELVAHAQQRLASGNGELLYLEAVRSGISAATLDGVMGWPEGYSNTWAEENDLPKFARGINNVPYDMDARIHEGEAIVPAAFNPYNPNAQKSGNDDTAAALRALADRLDRIEANTRATAGHTAGTDRKLARVIPGNALITEAA